MINCRRGLIFSALAATTLLAACGGGNSDAPEVPEENVINIEELEDLETPTENIVEPAPEPSATATPAPVTAPDLDDQTQILDDAESVGMTARVNRDEDSAPAE